MQHLLDNPGLVTALVTLILAVAGYIGVKTEQQAGPRTRTRSSGI